jgi:stage II sporulation protein D
VLRRALLTTSVGLLGCTGIASAKLLAGPVTTRGPTTAPPLVTTATTPTVAESRSASTLVISGHGWGHGVGMSQWGAYGYAEHGWGYRRILAHYYSGTTIGTDPAPTVRVLLLGGRKRLTLASDSPWKVVDAQGVGIKLSPKQIELGPRLVVSGRALSSPVTFSPGATPLRVGNASYRGSLRVFSTGKRLRVVNALPLEAYLLGVVGSEMPWYWPAPALEAQAVAARSYTLAELESEATAQPFDLYDDTRSQVYGGVSAESPAVTAAVQATAHEVVLYEGRVAVTYFSSSSGGSTVSAEEAFGKSIPYLLSVNDPYDTFSPYHDWGPVLVDARKAGRELKVGQLLTLEVTRDSSGRVVSVDAAGTKGTVQLSGLGVRSALGLRSSWFTVGWLALTRPRTPLARGRTGSLSGIARGIADVSLEEKVAGAWQTVSSVVPRADGAFSVAIQPSATTQYRLAAPGIRTAVVEVAVT